MEPESLKTDRDLARDKISLVVARLDTASPDLYFSSGHAEESCSRDEMIRHVEDGDEIGRSFVAEQMEFLRAFKDGSLADLLAQNL